TAPARRSAPANTLARVSAPGAVAPYRRQRLSGTTYEASHRDERGRAHDAAPGSARGGTDDVPPAQFETLSLRRRDDHLHHDQVGNHLPRSPQTYGASWR